MITVLSQSKSVLMCQILLKFLKPRNRFSKGLAAFRSCDEDAAKIFRLVSPFPLEQKRDIVKLEFSDNRRVEEKLPALLFAFHALWLTLSARVLSNAFSSTFMCYIMDFEPTSVIFFSASELYVSLVWLVHVSCMNVLAKDSDQISFLCATFVFQDSRLR